MTFFKNKLGDRRGQLIVESMVAIAVMVTGILGLFVLLSKSLAATKLVSSQYVAVHLAGEGIELVKNLLDKNAITRRATGGANSLTPWNQNMGPGTFEMDFNDGALTPVVPGQAHLLSFDEQSGRYFYASSAGGTGIDEGQSLTTPSIYKREIAITWLPAASPNSMSVVSTVWWSIRGTDYSVVLEDVFTNWRP